MGWLRRFFFQNPHLMPQAWHFFFKTPGSSLNGVGLAQLLIGYCDMLPDLPGMIWDNHSPASDKKPCELWWLSILFPMLRVHRKRAFCGPPKKTFARVWWTIYEPSTNYVLTVCFCVLWTIHQPSTVTLYQRNDLPTSIPLKWWLGLSHEKFPTSISSRFTI